jgi:tripartite-type tricarboxylate transporter receptor subunit TctC
MGSRFNTLAAVTRRAMVVTVVAGAGAALITGSINEARAKWPDRPVRLVLPYGPGGVADVPARIQCMIPSKEPVPLHRLLLGR